MSEFAGVIRCGADGEQIISTVRGLLAIDDRNDTAALVLVNHKTRPSEAALLLLIKSPKDQQFTVQYALPVLPNLVLKASGVDVRIGALLWGGTEVHDD